MSIYTDRIEDIRIEARLADMADELKTYAERLKMSIHIEATFVNANNCVGTPRVHIFPDHELLTIDLNTGDEMLGALQKARDIEAQAGGEKKTDD